MSSSKIFKDDPAFTPVPLVSKKKVQSPADSSLPRADNLHQEAQPPDTPSGTRQSTRLTADEGSLPLQPVPDIEEVKAKAYEQGRLEAEQAMESGLQQTLRAFTNACDEVDTLHQNLLEQSRGDMINLVIALSKKIIGRELTTGRDIIVDTLERAIELAIKHNEYDIWLHPDDLETAEKVVPKMISSVKKLEHITLKTDPSITRGGCKLDSNICTVDATIEAQLETAWEFLEEKGPNCSTPEQTDSRREEE